MAATTKVPAPLAYPAPLSLLLSRMVVTTICHSKANSRRNCEIVHLGASLCHSNASHANELGKLLNSAKQPIYVLDDDLTIVFLNRACQEWLGAAAEGLLGRQCAYHSSPAVGRPRGRRRRALPAAAGLSPAASSPPRSPALPKTARSIERRARFLPLGAGRGRLLRHRGDCRGDRQTPPASDAPDAETTVPPRRLRCTNTSAVSARRPPRAIGPIA